MASAVVADVESLLVALAGVDDLAIAGDDRAFAIFSADRVHRYALGRTWNYGKKPLIVTMLNPSTADERVVDPTVRKCLHFAQRDGYGGLIVTNLFSFRATDPRVLRFEEGDIVGMHNDAILKLALDESAVAGWGVPKWQFVKDRVAAVRALRPKWNCFGVSNDGHPLHPCYLANKTEIVPWQPSELKPP